MVITNPQSGCTNAFVLDEGKLTGVTATYNLEVVWMYDRRPFQEKSYTYIPPYSPYKEPEQRTFPFTPALQSEAKEGKKRFVDSCDICNDALAPLKWNASLGLYLCSSCEARFRADAAGVKRESAAEVVSDEDNDPDLDNGWPCEYCGSTTVTTHYNANTYCHLCDACEELYKQNPDKMNDELGGWCGG
jgi:transcription elongation factor Elf1